MKHIFLVFISIWIGQDLFAQKKEIDSTAYNTWSFLDGLPLISANGQFVAYQISRNKKPNLIIQSTKTNWKLVTGCVLGRFKFTGNSRWIVYLGPGDTLNILDLVTKATTKLLNIQDFNVPENGRSNWISYNNQENFTLKNLKTGKEILSSGKCYGYISENGETVLLWRLLKEKGHDSQQMEWIDLKTLHKRIVWKGYSAENLTLDFKHKQLAFKSNNTVWYYKIGMQAPYCLIDGVKTGQDTLWKYNPEKFSLSGDRLFITKKWNDNHQIMVNKDAVELWSYFDTKLQSVQESELNQERLSYLAVVDLASGKLIDLQKNKNEFFFNRSYEDLILSSNFYFGENWQSLSSKKQIFLINSKTGNRKQLEFLDKAGVANIELSPNGKYLIYYDFLRPGYFCYDVKAGEVYNLTQNVKTNWNRGEENNTDLRGIAAWLKNDESVLIYDSNDIWLFDLLHRKKPVNVTNAYGLKAGVVFGLALQSNIHDISRIDLANPKLILNAFNLENKDNGFYVKELKRNGDPELLSMDSYLYKTNSLYVSQDADFTPIKSNDGSGYIIRRMKANSAPNYCFTNDFRKFRQLSDLQPQKMYNWYTTELHSWQSLDGRKLQGILYKPENFDPNKKYPVIFNYYERKSDGLNAFLKPENSWGDLNIPTYVSNGYLVFCPDIYYKVGNPMQGTYDALVSAATYISKLPFVNNKKMGLQGFSFGGVQTNYLVTHSNLFAAACSASGISNWISLYNAINGDKGHAAGNFENGQLRMGKMLWENLSGYINNSAISNADKVKTPLLLMHTKNDGMSLYPNILEFFLGLRRLGKKCWMLVYPKGYHTIHGEESVDFTIRMEQFFDYYLKNKAAPIWMIEGIAAKERGIRAKIELDTAGRVPNCGLLSDTERKKVDSLTNRKSLIIKSK